MGSETIGYLHFVVALFAVVFYMAGTTWVVPRVVIYLCERSFFNVRSRLYREALECPGLWHSPMFRAMEGTVNICLWMARNTASLDETVHMMQATASEAVRLAKTRTAKTLTPAEEKELIATLFPRGGFERAEAMLEAVGDVFPVLIGAVYFGHPRLAPIMTALAPFLFPILWIIGWRMKRANNSGAEAVQVNSLVTRAGQVENFATSIVLGRFGQPRGRLAA